MRKLDSEIATAEAAVRREACDAAIPEIERQFAGEAA
jgi:hypothetical protein